MDRELDALAADMRARLARIGRLIAAVGLERVGARHVRHLTGPLWEIRLSGRDGIARALYVVAAGRRLVVVRAFVKKTRRTPRREIELALNRAKEVLQ
ncbi:MAG: type II toxin-antitoxin system RelE/ParE family toxin [Gammaproteobacteria bacterium]|nr:type II toxin-antitoxin system RelE/ParE family toxin [Gammaproteobacteria bacterium]